MINHSLDLLSGREDLNKQTNSNTFFFKFVKRIWEYEIIFNTCYIQILQIHTRLS